MQARPTIIDIIDMSMVEIIEIAHWRETRSVANRDNTSWEWSNAVESCINCYFKKVI